MQTRTIFDEPIWGKTSHSPAQLKLQTAASILAHMPWEASPVFRPSCNSYSLENWVRHEWENSNAQHGKQPLAAEALWGISISALLCGEACQQQWSQPKINIPCSQNEIKKWLLLFAFWPMKTVCFTSAGTSRKPDQLLHATLEGSQRHELSSKCLLGNA